MSSKPMQMMKYSHVAPVLALSFLLAATHAACQAPSPAPMTDSGATDCFTAVVNMSDCLTYVQEGSKIKSPEKGCCPALAGLLESNPVCLCQLFNTSNDFGLKLDTARAIGLPSYCRLSTPPVSTCALLGIPIGAPAPAPTPNKGQILRGSSPTGAPSSLSSPPSKGSSSFRISTSTFLSGLFGFAALIF